MTTINRFLFLGLLLVFVGFIGCTTDPADDVKTERQLGSGGVTLDENLDQTISSATYTDYVSNFGTETGLNSACVYLKEDVEWLISDENVKGAIGFPMFVGDPDSTIEEERMIYILFPVFAYGDIDTNKAIGPSRILFPGVSISDLGYSRTGDYGNRTAISLYDQWREVAAEAGKSLGADTLLYFSRNTLENLVMVSGMEGIKLTFGANASKTEYKHVMSAVGGTGQDISDSPKCGEFNTPVPVPMPDHGAKRTSLSDYGYWTHRHFVLIDGRGNEHHYIQWQFHFYSLRHKIFYEQIFP